MAQNGARPEVIQFILKDCDEHEKNKDTLLVQLDDVVHDYMLFGPPHSNSDPFPSEQDLSKSMEWLQLNNYIFLAGDDKIATSRSNFEQDDKKFSLKMLKSAINQSLYRLKRQLI